ncbi:MAG: hypothetical protein ACREJD_02470 [Phycisphaerales bacterium]
MKRSTPRRSRWRELASCAFALILASGTHAQKLHFSNDQPKPGSGEIAIKLAADAHTQADELREKGGESAVKDAKLAYLGAASALLEAGENKGVDGTFLVAAGTVMMRARDEVFAALDGRKLDRDGLNLLASDVALLAQNPPATSGELDRALRDAFANLLQGRSSAAKAEGALAENFWPWPELADASNPAWPDFSKLPDAAEGVEALRVLHDRCDLADKWTAFRPGARAMTRLVMDASWPLGHEKQIPAGVYRRWMFELADGAKEVVNESTGELGLARLRRLATLGRIFAQLDAMAPDPGAKQLEKALFAAVEIMPVVAANGAGAPVDGWMKLEQWVEIAAGRLRLMDDKQVVRQLRPALRTIGDLAKGSHTELFEALVRVAAKPDAAGDPGVMAAVNLFAENLQLLKVLRGASDAIKDAASPAGDPVARENAKPFTDGLLKLSKEVADPKQRDRSLGALRNLANDVAELLELRGEKRLREKDEAIESLMGGKSADVLTAIDRERLAWRRAVGAAVKPGTSSGGEANAARLRAIGVVLALAVDIAECKSIASDESSPLRQWGGWWLDGESLQKLATAAAGAIPEMMKAAESDAAAGAPASAERAAREHSVIVLAARLSRVLAGANPADRAEISLLHLRAIATGTPDTNAVLLGHWREKIAVVCRYAGEGEGNDSAKQFARTRASEYLDALIRSEETGR